MASLPGIKFYRARYHTLFLLLLGMLYSTGVIQWDNVLIARTLEMEVLFWDPAPYDTMIRNWLAGWLEKLRKHYPPYDIVQPVFEDHEMVENGS